MHHPMEILRRNVALAHAVPGATLRLRTASGDELVAARDAVTDINLCALRHAVAVSGCTLRAPGVEWARCLSLDGSLVRFEGDLHMTAPGDAAWYWFASTLTPGHILDLLEETSADYEDDGVVATVKPDPQLGVTSVGISGSTPAAWAASTQVALAAYRSVVVDELLVAARLDGRLRPTDKNRENKP